MSDAPPDPTLAARNKPRLAPEGVAIIDELIGALDAASLGETHRGGATSSFALVIAVWEQFSALVDALDAALSNPLADGAPTTLKRAAELVGGDAYRLSFWLRHVAEASEYRHRTL